MNFELSEQEVIYTFNNEIYTKGIKARTIKNVRPDVTPDNLNAVGQAMASLQDDELGSTVLVQKQKVSQA